MLKTLDLENDFWIDPEIRLLFKEEYTNKVSSEVMWALHLYIHPLSKFKDLDDKTRKILIKKDFLNDESFKFEDYTSTIEKIKHYVLTPAQRLISSWDKKIDEIQVLIDSIKIENVETYEQVGAIMSKLNTIMKQYKEIEKMFLAEQELATHGNVEESASEKGTM